MIRTFLALSIIFLAAMTSLVSANQKIELPNYKNWEIRKKDQLSLYTTVLGGCESKTVEELSRYKQYPRLKSDQYISTTNTSNESVDVIKNFNGKPWLLVYLKEGKIYLFKRKPKLFGYRWEFSDELNLDKNKDFELFIVKIAAFQIRNCLFFPLV